MSISLRPRHHAPKLTEQDSEAPLVCNDCGRPCPEWDVLPCPECGGPLVPEGEKYDDDY